MKKEVDHINDMGLSIIIPEDSVPLDESVDLIFQPIFSGSFEIPEGWEPASPLYLIETSKEIALRKNITVKMQHYANLQAENDCRDMTFLRACSKPVYRGSDPVYVFDDVEESIGEFSPDGSHTGEIAISEFSFWGIFCKKKIKIIKGKVTQCMPCTVVCILRSDEICT